MKIKHHTGCSCIMCRKGKDKKTRSTFHKKLRRIQKKELKVKGDIETENISIGYTD
jgi:hypothetical protein